MSIADELRDSIDHLRDKMADVDYELTDIADRIDAEHEALRDQLNTSERQKESYREDLLAANRQVHASYNDGFDDGFASADDWLGQHEDAMAMHGWVRLPKDADGTPIHVGDVMDSRVDYLFDGKPFTVRALVLFEDGWEVADGRFGNRYEPDSLRHHHAPTVEDVLREFTERVCDGLHTPKALDTQVIIAEYAAKLRLAEGVEQ